MFGNAIEVARRSDGPAVVTDARGAVVFWNDAAAALFGRAWRQVAGEFFPQTVGGRDVFGNPILHDADRFQELIQRGEGLHRYALDVVDAAGERLRLAVSLVVVLGPEASDERFVYELEPLERRRKTDLVAAERAAGAGARGVADRPSPLTERQAEIVRHLAEGKSSSEIARALDISPNTVRCHIQNVLQRLRVHTRAAAVAKAIRDELL